MNELPLTITVGVMGVCIVIALSIVVRALHGIRDELIRLATSIDRVKVAIEQQGNFRKNILGH